MRGPMLALAGVCVVIGLAPILFWPAVAGAVASWQPAWATAEPPAPLVAIGAAQAVLAILILAAAAWLWRKAFFNGVRRGPTWGCGYAAPTARMQYTSASFAGIISGWFSWIMLPERKVHRPRGLFPADAIRLERIPETVLERVINPISEAVLQISSLVRRLQHGRLQFYILYVVVALVALGLLVWLGGTQ